MMQAVPGLSERELSRVRGRLGYHDAACTTPVTDKLVAADVNEPSWDRRVCEPGLPTPGGSRASVTFVTYSAPMASDAPPGLGSITLRGN